MSNKSYGYVGAPKIIEDYGNVNVSKAEERDYVTAFEYLNKSIVPWADVFIAVHRVNKEIPPELCLFSEAHTHRANETYVVIGDLTIEVDIEGEKQIVSSPGVIVIPPGVLRCRRYVKGTGYLIVVVRIPEDPHVTEWLHQREV